MFGNKREEPAHRSEMLGLSRSETVSTWTHTRLIRHDPDALPRLKLLIFSILRSGFCRAFSYCEESSSEKEQGDEESERRCESARIVHPSFGAGPRQHSYSDQR